MTESTIRVFDTNTMPWEEKTNAATGKKNRRKTLMIDEDTGMNILITDNPPGFTTPTHIHPCAHGMYVLKGTQRTPRGDFGPGSFVWFPEGVVAEHGATDTDGVTAVFISNKTFDIKYLDGAAPEGDKDKITVIDTDKMEWEERKNARVGKSNYRKVLKVDEETGANVVITNYPGGFVNPLHDHPCSHGIYVLEGTLHTGVGNFGPGNFLWFPEGGIEKHGAAAPDGPGVKILFITNKAFDIRYVD